MIELKNIEAKKFYYNNLFNDYIFNFERVRDNYSYDYRDVNSYKERQKDLNCEYDKSSRNQLADILLAYNTKIGCSKQAINNIASLKNKETLVIIGGQQPGFLTGPVFIVYKILTILKLSDFFRELLKVKIVPVFWNASDDNNFKEVNSINILQNELKTISIDPSELINMPFGARFSNIDIQCAYIKEKIKDVTGSLNNTEFSAKINDFLVECIDYEIGKDPRGKIVKLIFLLFFQL